MAHPRDRHHRAGPPEAALGEPGLAQGSVPVPREVSPGGGGGEGPGGVPREESAQPLPEQRGDDHPQYPYPTCTHGPPRAPIPPLQSGDPGGSRCRGGKRGRRSRGPPVPRVGDTGRGGGTLPPPPPPPPPKPFGPLRGVWGGITLSSYSHPRRGVKPRLVGAGESPQPGRAGPGVVAPPGSPGPPGGSRRDPWDRARGPSGPPGQDNETTTALSLGWPRDAAADRMCDRVPPHVRRAALPPHRPPPRLPVPQFPLSHGARPCRVTKALPHGGRLRRCLDSGGEDTGLPLGGHPRAPGRAPKG
ncbi:basic salivary proline-rich protein 2-like [Cinclus cinclus]|uniref:basic salivary proline-rich protein 2-like n=1 Tax=Cinclus cinclus TaxID=127875 RepID=UPI002E154C1A